jgi:nucleoside-diphosphate-sugar epimerase
VGRGRTRRCRRNEVPIARVLVTGATSLLGQGTVRALLGRGDEVTVLQRHPSGLPCREVLGDIADLPVVLRAAEGQDAIVHLAAKVDVTGPWSQFARSNIDGTHAVVEACRATGVGSLVHVSSPAVAHHGQSLVGVDAEPADPDRARGNYARSKAGAELIALEADSPELAVLCIRPHLVWGPGDTQLVARIVARARQCRLPVLGSGAALIDTTYIDNAVRALVAAVDACPAAHGQALVVSNGEPRTVKEILAHLCRAAGVPEPVWSLPVPAAMALGTVTEGAWRLLGRRDTPPLTRFLVEQLTTAHWFDQRRTRELLRWTPEISLDEGFARLTTWYREGGEARSRG